MRFPSGASACTVAAVKPGFERDRKRVKAARAIAGFDSHRDLEAAVRRLGNRYKLSWSTIGKIESRDQIANQEQLDLIARACRLPPEWFTVPDLAEAVRLGALALSAPDEGGEEPGAPDLPPRPTPRQPSGGQQQTG